MILLFLQPLTTFLCYSVSLDLTALATSHKKNHTVFVLLLPAIISELPFFLRLNKTSLYIFIIISFSIHSPVDGHFPCFHILAVAKISALKMSAQISPQDPAFHSFGYIARRGIAGSNDNSIFSILKNPGTVSIKVHKNSSISTSSSINFYFLFCV